MNKSSFLNNKALDKSDIALICIFGICVGFLFSVVVLSIFTFFFGINGIWGIHPRRWLRNKWWLAGVAWVLLYALTYFWSADKAQWHIRFQTKLPILILPLAISYLPRFSAKQLQQITLSLAVTLLISAGYSISFLIRDPAYYISAYQFAHLLPTIPHDYIRISITMTLFILWCVYVWPLLSGRTVKWFIGCTIAILVIYIHILAAKSGLISLYLFLIGWSIYLAFSKKRVAGIAVLVAIPLFYVLAINFVPTFRQRADYIGFTYIMFKTGDRSGNYGDVNRLMSYKVAWMYIKEHPLTGVGAGDMLNKMAEGYHSLYPQVPRESVLLPHNEFLIEAFGCGIPAMIIFAIWVFMPLTGIRKNRQSFFFFIVWIILFLQVMIEPVLEVQYGVFIYLFFLIMLMHEMPDNKVIAQ